MIVIPVLQVYITSTSIMEDRILACVSITMRVNYHVVILLTNQVTTRTEGGGRTPFPQGFDPLPTQRVPLCTILRHPFLVTYPKNFIKATWTPICTFQNRVFQIFKIGSFWCLLCFGRAPKINLVDLKKLRKLSPPPPPPRENPRSAPGYPICVFSLSGK